MLIILFAAYSVKKSLASGTVSGRIGAMAFYYRKGIHMLIENHYGFSGSSTRVLSGADETRFIALEASNDAAYWVQWTLHAPISETYIMLPACAYDGNRFEGVHRRYPPMFTEDEMGVDVPTRMTEVPRLSPEGDSFMDVTTGDLSTPCVCVLNKKNRTAFMVFFEQGAHSLNHGVTLEQEGDKLHIVLRAPAKRRLVYRWYEGYPSLRENPEADAPLHVNAGDETVITHRVFAMPCRDIPELYRIFFEKRALLYRAASHASLPFSAAWDMSEEQYNLVHFDEKNGFYTLQAIDTVGCGTDAYQPGWVGGGMSTLPLMVNGSELSFNRSMRALDFSAKYQSKKGFYYGVVNFDTVMHDCFGHYGDKYNMLLIRKHADLVYFMFKQIEVLKKMGKSVPENILTSATRAADALVSLWKQYGQLGQFVNAETGEIVVGGSTSGAIAPAALCAAAIVTGNAVYAEAAREIGRFFYRTATLTGVTTGGPGEILQAPDSESSAALLESFVALYDMDETDEWLKMACDAAHQLASWVVPYDYEFPKTGQFGRLGIRSAGSVWANVQNKHSSPGLCTLSAASLLKLYRATGNENYLRMMREIAHFIPQVASRPDRPVLNFANEPLLPGKMCERVNLSDWEGQNNVGGSIFGPCSWPEVSMMLNWTEVPGIYAIPSRGVLCVSDHVNARLENGRIVIENPTTYPARVKVMIETEESLSRPMGLYWLDAFRIVNVESGETVVI